MAANFANNANMASLRPLEYPRYLPLRLIFSRSLGYSAARRFHTPAANSCGHPFSTSHRISSGSRPALAMTTFPEFFFSTFAGVLVISLISPWFTCFIQGQPQTRVSYDLTMLCMAFVLCGFFCHWSYNLAIRSFHAFVFRRARKQEDGN